MPKQTSQKEPAKETPDWEKLEIIIAEIQRELAPNAIVTHNDKIRGKMVNGRRGRIRKLDVSIKKKIGTVEVLIAIDAKHHKRPVDRGLVAKFAEQIKDVGAFGIMISDSGFDGGARDVAHVENILLQTYEEAKETDWEKLVGKGAWFVFNHIHFSLKEVLMILVNGKKLMGVPRNLILYNQDGSFYGQIDGKPWTFSNLFTCIWENSEKPRQIGDKVHLDFDQIEPPLFVPMSQNTLARVDIVILKGTVTPKKYAANISMSSGKIIGKIDVDNPEYIKGTTELFDPMEIIKSQEGVEYTQEEWERQEKEVIKPFQISLEEGDIVQITLTGVQKESVK